MNHSSTSLNYIANNRQIDTTNTTKSKPRFRPPLDLDDDDVEFNSSFYGKARVEEEKPNNSDVDNSDRLHESIRSLTDIFAVHQESSRSLVKSGDIIFDDSERTEVPEEDDEGAGPEHIPPIDISEQSTVPDALRLSHQSDASSVGDILAVHQTAYTQRSRRSSRQDLPISKLSFTSAKVAKKLLPLVAEVAFESSSTEQKKERKPNRLSIEGLVRPKSSDSFTNLRSTQYSNEDKNTSWGLVRRKSSGSFGSTRNNKLTTSDSNNKNASWDINNNNEAPTVLYKRKPSSDSLVSLELQSTKIELENVKAQLAELRSRSLTPSARRIPSMDVSERTTDAVPEDESTLRLSHQSDASSVGDVLAVHQMAYTAPHRQHSSRRSKRQDLPISKLSFTSAKVAKKLLPLVAEVAFESSENKPTRLARPKSSDNLVADEGGRSRPGTPSDDNITGMPRCIPPIDVSERTTEEAAVGDDDESALRLSHQSNASSVGDVLAVHQTAYAPRRSSRRRSMGDTPDKNPLQLSFISAKLAKKLLPQVEEVTNEGGESSKESKKKNKKERKPNRLSIEGLRVPTKEGPPTRPTISRRHSMSDVAPASRWSLALAKYEKDKPQEDKKKSSPSSKFSSSTVLRSRRASTGDCPDEVLDFEGLTPKLSREVERLSQSSGTALTVCSTELESSLPTIPQLEEEIESVEGSRSEDETPPRNRSRAEKRSKTFSSKSSSSRSKKSDDAQVEDKSNSKSSKLSSLDNLKDDVKKKNKKNKKRPKHPLKKMSTSMSDVYEKTSKQKKSKSSKKIDKRSLYFKSISVDNLLDESVSSLEASLRSTGLDESVNSNDVSELFNRLMVFGRLCKGIEKY